MVENKFFRTDELAVFVFGSGKDGAAFCVDDIAECVDANDGRHGGTSRFYGGDSKT